MFLVAHCLQGREKFFVKGRGNEGRPTCSNSQWVHLPSGCCRQLKHSPCFKKCCILSFNVMRWTRMCELECCLPQPAESHLQRTIQLTHGWEVSLAVHKGREQWGARQRAIKCCKWITAHCALVHLKLREVWPSSYSVLALNVFYLQIYSIFFSQF